MHHVIGYLKFLKHEKGSVVRYARNGPTSWLFWVNFSVAIAIGIRENFQFVSATESIVTTTFFNRLKKSTISQIRSLVEGRDQQTKLDLGTTTVKWLFVTWLHVPSLWISVLLSVNMLGVQWTRFVFELFCRQKSNYAHFFYREHACHR